MCLDFSVQLAQLVNETLKRGILGDKATPDFFEDMFSNFFFWKSYMDDFTLKFLFSYIKADENQKANLRDLFAAHVKAFSHRATQYLGPFCEESPPTGFQLCAFWRANKNNETLPWVMTEDESDENSNLILVEARLTQILESLRSYYSPLEGKQLARTLCDTKNMMSIALQRVPPSDWALTAAEKQQLSDRFDELGRSL